jgi:uncharacterized protein with FMN-binding domain
MRKIVLWGAGTVVTVVLLFGYHTSTQGAEPRAASSHQRPVGAGRSTTGGTKVTGDAANTEWGPVQVELTTKAARITDVEVVEYPNGNSLDAQINQRALPQLVHETLTAQSADIDMVSGATVTSVGYLHSLQSALDKAGL